MMSSHVVKTHSLLDADGFKLIHWNEFSLSLSLSLSLISNLIIGIRGCLSTRLIAELKEKVDVCVCMVIVI